MHEDGGGRSLRNVDKRGNEGREKCGEVEGRPKGRQEMGKGGRGAGRRRQRQRENGDRAGSDGGGGRQGGRRGGWGSGRGRGAGAKGHMPIGQEKEEEAGRKETKGAGTSISSLQTSHFVKISLDPTRTRRLNHCTGSTKT